MIGSLTADGSTIQKMNTPTPTKIIIALQTAAYCCVFISLWYTAIGASLVSLFFAFGLGGFRCAVLD